MATRWIPDSDTLMRYVRRGQIGHDGEIDDAFRLRANETTLSTTWVEYWNNLPRAQQIANAIEATQMRKASDELVTELPVRRVLSQLSAAGFTAGIRHSPTGPVGVHSPNPAHTGITGLPLRGDTRNSLQAARALAKSVSRTYPPLQHGPKT